MMHLLKPLQIVFFVSFQDTKSALALLILISILFTSIVLTSGYDSC